MQAPKPLPFISRADHQTILHGVCPNCNEPRFALGPRGGMARNILCIHCWREYNVSIAGTQIINLRCPDERMEEVYHVTLRPIAGHPQA